MDKFLHSRLFRCLVCLVLVCCILVNCSPIRAKATAIVGPVAAITGIGFLAWMMAMSAGVLIEPTVDAVNAMGKSLQNSIDIWIEDTAEDISQATESWRESCSDIEDWLAAHPNYKPIYTDPDLGPDPDWGIDFTDGAIALGSSLMLGFAKWVGECIASGKLGEVEEEVEVEIPEGYASYNGNILPHFDPSSLSPPYPYSTIFYNSFSSKYYFFHSVESGYWHESLYEYLSPSGWRFYVLEADSSEWSYGGVMNLSGGLLKYNKTSDSITLPHGELVWSSYDILDYHGNLYFAGSSPITSDYTTTEIKSLTPEKVIGEIGPEIQNGNATWEDIRFPDTMTAEKIITSKDTALQEMQDVYNNVYNENITYNEFVENITQTGTTTEPGTGTETTPGTGTDPSPSPDTPPATEPWVPSGMENFTLDLKKFFPFCIPFDLYAFLTCLNAEPEAPVISWQVPTPGGGAYPLEIDLSAFDSVAQLLRLLQLLLFCVGLAFKTRDLIKG